MPWTFQLYNAVVTPLLAETELCQSEQCSTQTKAYNYTGKCASSVADIGYNILFMTKMIVVLQCTNQAIVWVPYVVNINMAQLRAAYTSMLNILYNFRICIRNVRRADLFQCSEGTTRMPSEKENWWIMARFATEQNKSIIPSNNTTQFEIFILYSIRIIHKPMKYFTITDYYTEKLLAIANEYYKVFELKDLTK